MLSLSCRFLNRFKRPLIAGLTSVSLLMGASYTTSAADYCDNGPIYTFSQAVYASDFEQAQNLITIIRRERNDDMADFLQQVLIYTRGYETGVAREQAAALADIDALIQRLTTRLETDRSLQLRLDAGNIMMNAARMNLLSRNVMVSAQLAKTAYRLLDEILEQNPQQADAYLSIGLYLYFAANENNAWGWVKRLLNLEGDKQRGRQFIERAVQASDDFSFEATRSLMMDMAWDQPAVCRYVEIFESLDMPEIKTIEHRQRTIAALLFCGQPERAAIEIQKANTLIERHTLLASELQVQWLFEAELQSMAMQGQSSALREWLLASSKVQPETAMIIRFSLARSLDVKGERTQAVQHYEQVADSGIAERYQQLAEIYQQQAYYAPRRYSLPAHDRIKPACNSQNQGVRLD